MELVTEEDASGESFFFKIIWYPSIYEGRELHPSAQYAKRVSAKDYNNLLTDAVSANMNMLRVWEEVFMKMICFMKYVMKKEF